jgi:tRNA(Ile)-lysidine synthase TilS/MesJ
MEKTQLVMFTGGRDSTLTSALLMLRNIPVQLYTANSGCSVHRDVIHYRIDELKDRFGDLMVGHTVADISGTFRSIALENIESDILKYKKNLIVLGEKFALHVHLVDFCLRNKISVVNDGLSSYQQSWPDQRNVAREFLIKFMAHYKISYNSPVYKESTSVEIVKYRLMQIGLCNKPLEGSTLFGDTFSEADDNTILEYLKEKEELAHSHVEFITQGIFKTSKS